MPTQNDLHIDKLLTDVAIATMQSADNFIANKVFPDVPVSNQSDKYPVIPAGDFHRDQMEKRADSTESAGGNWKVSTDSYFADVWALHKDIGDQQRANADAEFRLNSNTTKFLAHQALNRREAIFAATATVTGVWGTDDGTKNWTGASSTPIKDVRTASRTMQLKTGWRPNVAVLSRDVFDTLMDHPDFLARVTNGAQQGAIGQGAAQVSKNIMAEMFDVNEVHVLDAIINTAKEGETDSNAFHATEICLLLYVAEATGEGIPTAGLTFSWSGFLGQGGLGTRVRNIRMPAKSADRIEIEQAFDMKVTVADLGHLFHSVLS